MGVLRLATGNPDLKAVRAPRGEMVTPAIH